MSADRRTAAWAAKYSELLQTFADALGGDDIPPAKLAICRTIATLQTELSVLGNQFANGAVGADDLNKYIKISATVGTLLQSIGLDQVLQKPPVDQSRGGDAHEKLMEILDKIVAARVFEESKGVFRNRNGDVLDNTNHVEGCECKPCHWRRGVGDVEAAEAARVAQQVHRSRHRAASTSRTGRHHHQSRATTPTGTDDRRWHRRRLSRDQARGSAAAC